MTEKISESEKLCLIAAFDRFIGIQSNHSETVVNALPLLLDNSIRIEKILLSTCCSQSWETLNPYLETDFDALILTGACWGSTILLERFALNMRDYPVKDNKHHLWRDSRIDDSGPDAFMTHFPLRSLETHLRGNDYFCEISDHAGTFLCNEVYFRALQYKHDHSKRWNVIFVHLPPPEKFWSKFVQHAGHTSNLSRLKLLMASRQQKTKLLAKAVLEIARFCVCSN